VQPPQAADHPRLDRAQRDPGGLRDLAHLGHLALQARAGARQRECAGAPALGRADRRRGATGLALDPGGVTALTGLGVGVAPIAPANDKLEFPLTNAPFWALLSGTIKHSGGLALTAGATTVQLEAFWIDPLRRQRTAVVNGGARVPILSLHFARARIGLGGGTLNVGPVAGRLTPVAASAFGLPAGTVSPGLKLGDATVRYRIF
jgi:hypothetical protein